MRILSVAALLPLALLLGACDAGDDSAAMPADSIGSLENTDDIPDSAVVTTPPGANDGCAIIGQPALERAVGFEVVMNDNTTGNCVATPASGDASAPTVDFRIEPRTTAYDYFAAQPDATPIAALGERAIWATLNETTGYVVAVKQGRSYIVGVGEADGVTATSRRQAEAVARLLLDGSR
jgi:hypothetical protein